MKKQQPALQKRQPRRLSLSRETIQVLNDPALLELARGGKVGSNIDSCDTVTVSDTGC